MTDIFISYSSEDKSRVQDLARALERKGWSVWWDRRIPIGRSFDEVIEEALDASKAVVVVWTTTSVKSQWVKNEAREGLRRRVLFPVMMLEEVKIPLEFRDVQAAHLRDWQPKQEHAGFDQFIEDLTGVIGAPMISAAQPSPIKQSQGPAFVRSSSTPEPDRAPLRSAEVEQEPERSETRPFVITAGIGLIAALGALVLGVLVSFLLFSQNPSPPYQPTSQAPSPRTEGVTPTPAPEPTKQVSTATAQEKPVVRQGAGPTKAITGKDGAPMVLIPVGEFTMGLRDEDKSAQNEERPVHSVYLDAFYIDQYEVTTAHYAKFFEATNRGQPGFWSANVVTDHGNKPVVGVDWNDANAYCAWVGKRLPSEAEWEKAARGTDQRAYPWGNQVPTEQRANFNHCCDFKHYGVLIDVGSYEAGKSPYGTYDMAGNVWEWVSDWYDEHYYSKSPERNPKGPSNGEYRVVRGGSWGNEPVDIRSALRNRGMPTERYGGIGFRCAQDVPK